MSCPGMPMGNGRSLGNGGGRDGGEEVLLGGGGDGFRRKLVALQMASREIFDAEIRASTSAWQGLTVRSRMNDGSRGLWNFFGSFVGTLCGGS